MWHDTSMAGARGHTFYGKLLNYLMTSIDLAQKTPMLTPMLCSCFATEAPPCFL
jgi:hypothetical protein